MNKQILIQMLVFQIILIIVLIIAFFYLFRTRRYYLFEKRISKYTLTGLKRKDISLGDKVFNIFDKYLKILSNKLKKSSYIKTRAKTYLKYTSIKFSKKISVYDIFAFKIIMAIIFGILYLLSSTINYKFNVAILIIVFISGYYFYDLYLAYSFGKRKRRIESDLLKAIIIMNNAFKSGYNITQAITLVINNLSGPIKEEFVRIANDLTYGLDLSEVFDQFYERVQIMDARYITSSLSLLNETGGNLIGIFNSIETSFTNKKRLRDELIAMTSSSTLIYRILVGMPFVLVGLILIVNPTYFNPLFTNILGYMILILSIGLLIGYIIIIKRILRVDEYER